jgi:peptidoglycan/LPS O-acetylase OafA/YrhL
MKRSISDNQLQLDALDGLRGFAALIVIFSHTSNASMYFLPFLDARGIGKSGVFLFFLLSSFLLSRALILKGSSAFSLPSINHYAQRRFFRIYPLYTLYLLAALVSTALISSFFNRENIGIPFSLTLSEFFNHIILTQGKGVTWSIAVEFKFYFVLPLLIFISQFFKSKLGLISEVVFLLFLVFITQLVSPQYESLTNDARLLPYMCIFILGVLLAVIQCHIESGIMNKNSFKALVPLSYFSVLLLLFMTPSGGSLILGDLSNNYFHKSFIQYALLWSVILLSIINFDTKLTTFFKGRALCFYGSLSFSIYLFHPIFIAIAKKLGVDSYISAWFVLISSTMISYLFFRFFELPVSKLKLSYNKQQQADLR